MFPPQSALLNIGYIAAIFASTAINIIRINLKYKDHHQSLLTIIGDPNSQGFHDLTAVNNTHYLYSEYYNHKVMMQVIVTIASVANLAAKPTFSSALVGIALSNIVNEAHDYILDWEIYNLLSKLSRHRHVDALNPHAILELNA